MNTMRVAAFIVTIHLMMALACAAQTVQGVGCDAAMGRLFTGKEREIKRVFFIGNSYTAVNDLPGVLAKMALSGKPLVKIFYEHHLPGGSTLQMHAANSNVINTIKTGKWDAVVLQEQSMMPVENSAYMYAGARLLDKAIRSSGARTFFYMTWARGNKPEMIDPLAGAYMAIGKELGAVVVPVGRAWQMAKTANHGMSLHASDNSHPTTCGTYLAACVFYAVFTGRSPEGLSDGGLNNVSAADRLFLQRVAWNAVKEYGGGN